VNRLFPFLMVVFTALTGCSGISQQAQQKSAALADVRAKLSFGSCNIAVAEQVMSLKEPALEQETAYLCLQQGELEAAEKLLAGYSERHVDPPFPDYAAYLLALTDFVRFESSIGDDEERLARGRIAHDNLVRFVRLYPNSAYRSEVAPRLAELQEGMARAEYQLAHIAIESGAGESGAARLKYVVRQYPRSAAAKDAGRWLENHSGSEN